MNKIYIGIERYNLTKLKLYGACNPLVVEQSVEEIWSGLGGACRRRTRARGTHYKSYSLSSARASSLSVHCHRSSGGGGGDGGDGGGGGVGGTGASRFAAELARP